MHLRLLLLHICIKPSQFLSYKKQIIQYKENYFFKVSITMKICINCAINRFHLKYHHLTVPAEKGVELKKEF